MANKRGGPRASGSGVRGDDIGARGEAIFYVKITNFCDRGKPYFRPHFLGEKFATLDYIVELVDAGTGSPYFFVQVKTTTQGFSKKALPPRLKVGVNARDVKRMAAYPGPTYVVGIDETNEEGYLVAVHGKMSSTIGSLPSTYPLDGDNLKRLWDEVKDFWDSRDMVMKHSAFSI